MTDEERKRWDQYMDKMLGKERREEIRAEIEAEGNRWERGAFLFSIGSAILIFGGTFLFLFRQ